jgi:hypothetical protein
MARLNIAHLPAPTTDYRIDRLAPDPEGKLLFETRIRTRAEDHFRARLLRRRSSDSLIDGKAALALAERLEGSAKMRAGSLASSQEMRRFRIKMIGNLWRLVDEQAWPLSEVRSFTVLPKGWDFTPETLHQADPKKLLERFRSQLRRKGSDNAVGSLIAGLHGEFEPEAGIYQLHLHGLADREMIEILDSLRPMPAYRRRPLVTSPIRIARQPLEDLPYPLGYPFKSYWPSRRIGPVGDHGAIKRERDHRRIPEVYHSQVLLWLDRWSLTDTILLMNMRVGTDGFVIPTDPNAHQFEEIEE